MTLQELLKSERQWTRQQRIQHAKYRVLTGTPEEKALWTKALNAYDDNPTTERPKREYKPKRKTKRLS